MVVRAEDVRVGQICADLGAKDHARSLTVDGPLAPAGIVKRTACNVERENLRGIDRAERSGGNAVDTWVERCRGNESSPFRPALHPCSRRIVEDGRIPTLDPDFPDCVVTG